MPPCRGSAGRRTACRPHLAATNRLAPALAQKLGLVHQAAGGGTIQGNHMKRLSIAGLALLLGGGEALAVTRHDVTNMNCEQIKALLRSEGSAILRFPASEVAGLRDFRPFCLRPGGVPSPANPGQAARAQHGWKLLRPAMRRQRPIAAAARRAVIEAACFWRPFINRVRGCASGYGLQVSNPFQRHLFLAEPFG